MYAESMKNLDYIFQRLIAVSRDIRQDPLNEIAWSYTVSYSLCYIFSAIVGLHVAGLGHLYSALLLSGAGVGMLIAILTRSTLLLGIFASLEALGAVVHFLGMVPWMPRFSDTAYVVMSVLDLIQSMFLFKLIRMRS